MKHSTRTTAVLLLLLAFATITCKKKDSPSHETNKVPIALAGPDLVIELPNNSATITGALSKDWDGKIISYKWNKISGPDKFTIDSPYAVTTKVSNLQLGEYVFELRVEDDLGASATDNLKIVVKPPNKTPIARAGKDTSISLTQCGENHQILLDGSASYDPDSSGFTVIWRKLAGPGQVVIDNPVSLTTGLNWPSGGDYSFELQITDYEGAIAKDTVNLHVDGSPTSYDVDLNVSAPFAFTNNLENCYYGCTYADVTYFSGISTHPTLQDITITIAENADTAFLATGHVTSFSMSSASSSTWFISGECSVNFKLLNENGGGAFSGTFTLSDASAKNCDPNSISSMTPLQISGNLNKANNTISLAIKGKIKI